MPTLYGKKVYVSAHTEAKMEIHIVLAQHIGFTINRKRIEETHFANCKQFYRTESDAITVTETWEAKRGSNKLQAVQPAMVVTIH